MVKRNRKPKSKQSIITEKNKIKNRSLDNFVLFAEIDKLINEFVSNRKDLFLKDGETIADSVAAFTLSLYKDLASQLGFANGDVYRVIEKVNVVVVVHDEPKFAGEMMLNAWGKE